jgi:hypothetical protein
MQSRRYVIDPATISHGHISQKRRLFSEYTRYGLAKLADFVENRRHSRAWSPSYGLLRIDAPRRVGISGIEETHHHIRLVQQWALMWVVEWYRRFVIFYRAHMYQVLRRLYRAFQRSYALSHLWRISIRLHRLCRVQWTIQETPPNLLYDFYWTAIAGTLAQP